MSKYRAVRCQSRDGQWFASKAERNRYEQLKLLERAGEITHLETQPRFILSVNGVKVGTYVADFVYFDRARSRRIIEDVKGVRTPVYKLKKKLVEALYPGVVIAEITT